MSIKVLTNMLAVSQPETETWTTPPSTPTPLIKEELGENYPPLSRRSSRPTSLRLDEKAGSWNSNIVLEEASPDIAKSAHVQVNGRVRPASPSAMERDETMTQEKLTARALPPGVRYPPVSSLHAMKSPCFVHSHLDKGISLSDWLNAKQKQKTEDVNKAWHHRDDVIRPKHEQASPNGHFTNITPPSPGSSSYGSLDDDDEYHGSLTKQLAETAAGVREMSKALGRARVHSNIQNVLIITKARDNGLIKLTRDMALYLMLKKSAAQPRGLVVYVDNQLRKSRRFDAEGIKRDHPELFVPFPRRRSSSQNSLSSMTGNNNGNYKEDYTAPEEGQLRYWTSDMCIRSPHLFDFVVTLGGDGTVLFTSWLFQRIVPPVLSFALGSLGFLTNFDFADHKAVMDSALDTGIRVNLRMRFTCTVYRAVVNEQGKGPRAVKKGETGEIMMRNLEKGGWEALEGGWASNPPPGSMACKDKEIMCFTTRPVETFEVLNDLVVDRGPSPYMSLLELFGDDHHMTTVQADGLCVATPTGSTAYSLSAGGSLVHPEIPALLISPICPHTLSFRPMLLPDSMELRICVPFNSRSTAWASFDGRGRVELRQGDHIKVEASQYPFPTVCADKQSTDWFHAISRTLKWNERERQKSFVVVEEGPRSKSRKTARENTTTEKHHTHPLSVQEDQYDEEDEEDETETTEDDDTFDIDDSSPEAAANGTIEEEAKEDSHEATPAEVAAAALSEGNAFMRAVKARSRSRSRSSGVRSGVETPDRFAGPHPHPPKLSPRHSTLLSHHLAPDSTQSSSDSIDDMNPRGLRDQFYAGKTLSDRSRIPRDRDLDPDVRTPTGKDLVHSMLRGHHHKVETKDPGLQHHRAFAVWGQDESSDSNASDSDP